jgi:DnaJ-domain-containing protein 1
VKRRRYLEWLAVLGFWPGAILLFFLAFSFISRSAVERQGLWQFLVPALYICLLLLTIFAVLYAVGDEMEKARAKTLLDLLTSADPKLVDLRYYHWADTPDFERYSSEALSEILIPLVRQGLLQQPDPFGGRLIIDEPLETSRVSNPRDSALAILGLESTASRREIQERFHLLSRIHHPDRWSHAGKDLGDHATAIFKRISEAYSSLMSDRRDD